jgi:fatty acid desaturase
VNDPDPSGPDLANDLGKEASLVTLLRALIEDTQSLVEAEAGYWRAALAYALGRAKNIALLLVLALFFAFFTLMAIVVGLLLALAPLIGAWAALALVAVTLGLLTVLALWLVIRRGKRMIRLLTGSGAEDAR